MHALGLLSFCGERVDVPLFRSQNARLLLQTLEYFPFSPSKKLAFLLGFRLGKTGQTLLLVKGDITKVHLRVVKQQNLTEN